MGFILNKKKIKEIIKFKITKNEIKNTIKINKYFEKKKIEFYTKKKKDRINKKKRKKFKKRRKKTTIIIKIIHFLIPCKKFHIIKTFSIGKCSTILYFFYKKKKFYKGNFFKNKNFYTIIFNRKGKFFIKKKKERKTKFFYKNIKGKKKTSTRKKPRFHLINKKKTKLKNYFLKSNQLALTTP